MTRSGKKVGFFSPGLYLQDNLMKLFQNFRSFRTPYETSKNGVFCRNFDFRPPILPSTFSRKYFFGAKNSPIPVLQRWDNIKTLQIESSYAKITCLTVAKTFLTYAWYLGNAKRLKCLPFPDVSVFRSVSDSDLVITGRETFNSPCHGYYSQNPKLLICNFGLWRIPL